MSRLGLRGASALAGATLILLALAGGRLVEATNATDMKASTAMTNDMRTGIDELAELIVLDPRPSSVKWQTRSVGAGSDWLLVAILQYEEEALAALLEELEPKPALNGNVGVRPFGWEELDGRDGWGPGPNGMQVPSEGVLDAARFERSPLSGGFAVPLSATTLLVQMSTS